MDKTININLGGVLFQVDEEAYQLLREYLNAINARFRGVQGAAETIEDIEARIAEIFQSQRGIAGVITKPNVEAMISIIGKPEDFEAEKEEPRSAYSNSSRRRLYRNPDERIISGVCGGLGAYLDTDPVIFRILFAVFAICFGVGFLVYLVLWIALPVADTEMRRREMYGDSYMSAMSRERMSGPATSVGNTSYNPGYYRRTGVSNAFNEIFGAIGRVFFIILRVFLAIIGVVLVVSASLLILSWVMIFIFKYPGAFSTDALDVNIAYFPDFLSYVVSPEVAPWILILGSVVILLPMIALIYWGVKMIFWFSVRDGIYNLAALILWVVSAAALSMILFNEGISFAEQGRSQDTYSFDRTPSTLYIKPTPATDSLKFERTFDLVEERYRVLINENRKEMYISPWLRIRESGSESPSLTIKRESTGRSNRDALERSKELKYTWKLKGDTLFLDSYFTVPSGRKWSADNVSLVLRLPSGTRVAIDSETVTLLGLRRQMDGRDDYDTSNDGSVKNYLVTENGLERDENENRLK